MVLLHRNVQQCIMTSAHCRCHEDTGVSQALPYRDVKCFVSIIVAGTIYILLLLRLSWRLFLIIVLYPQRALKAGRDGVAALGQSTMREKD